MWLGLLAWFGAALAAPVEPRQVLAAVRAFAYDRHLVDRIGAEVHLAVVFSGQGAQTAQQIRAVLEGLGSFTLHDRPVKITLMDADVFSRSPQQVDVVLIAPGCDAHLPDIANVATAHGILTAGFSLDDLQAGVPIVVVEGAGRLRLLVDLDASRAVGAAFSSQLLQLAEIQP